MSDDLNIPEGASCERTQLPHGGRSDRVAQAMIAAYLFNLVLGGVLFGWGVHADDSYLWFAGILLVTFNILPFLPWKEEA